MGTVANTGWKNTLYHLDYSKNIALNNLVEYAQGYSGINKFTTFMHPKFGMQYSGQFSMHGHSNERLIGMPNFYMHMWFWTCLEDEAYTLFSVGPAGKATSETVAADS